VVLGEQRLAILDLSPAGHQPMLSKDGRTAITFNGEIYNFPELRAELEAQGVTFHSHSDTEVLLEGYARWGMDVLEHLVGMFAFAIWDARTEQLFLARDRTGEKPLYYAQTPDNLAFASEVQAFKELPWVDLTLDREALSLYLTYQYIPAPYSIYQGVRKLPPAHAMVVSREGARTWRYWDPLSLPHKPPLADEEALEQLEALLRQAVKGQMLADVHLGAFLSGGIDSSAVVSMMTELASGPVKTFTIGFDVPGYDEAVHAAAVAERLGTDHTAEVLTEQDALKLVPQIPSIYGEPFGDSSALPTYLVSTVARKHVTVSLSGDGGDEAFGGYARYGKLELLSSVLSPTRPLHGLAKPVLQRMPRRFAFWTRYLNKPPSEIYRGLSSVFTLEEAALLSGAQAQLGEYDRAWKLTQPLPARRRAMLADILTYLPEAILTKVDRAAMATSLETRAPFLDHRLLEFTLRLGRSQIKDKALLKTWLYKRIPQALLERPKQGFAVPLDRWFRQELRETLRDALAPERLEKLGLQHTEIVTRLVREHLSGEAEHTPKLWTLLVLSLWAEGAEAA
jgi:asparagine synthase (glutamine-hydrolysing)